MTNTERQRVEMLTRVENFGTTYGQLFPESSLAQPAFAAIAAAIDQIQAQQVAEKTATVSARAARSRSARAALVERLAKVAATARVISTTNSELGDHFTLTPAATDPELLTTAQGFARNAAPFAAAFVAHGMAPTFLEDLQASIATFEQARLTRGKGRNEQTAARAGIRKAMAAARAAVRTLDVIIANHAGLDTAVREVWARDRRISTPRVSSKNAAPAAAEDKPAAA